MSDPIWLAIIAAIPPTILAAATLVVSIRNSDKTDKIQKTTDGMKDALVTAARIEGERKGIEKGREMVRAKDDPKSTGA